MVIMKIGNQQRNNNLIKDINRIIKLYNTGYSQQQLGKMYNVSNATIRYYLLKNNVKIRNLKDSSPDASVKSWISSPVSLSRTAVPGGT